MQKLQSLSISCRNWGQLSLCFFHVLGVGVASVLAGADFSSSTIQTSSKSPVEGDLLEFRVTLRNTGDTRVENATLVIEWPSEGFLVHVPDLPVHSIDYKTRTITTSLVFEKNDEHSFAFQILAPRKGGGNILSVSIRLEDFLSGTRWIEHESVVIETGPSTSGILIGRNRITTPGIVLIAWVFASFCLWFVLKWKRRSIYARQAKRSRAPVHASLFAPRMIVAAIMIPIAFFLVFGGMAWKDWLTFTAWQETQGVIVGRRELVQLVPDETKNDGQAASESSSATPQYALRYQVQGKEIISSGYDTGTSLRIGGRVMNGQEMRDWTVGTTIRCWYNPADPKEVIVRRGFCGSNFFGLLPIPLLLFGLSRLRQTWRARAD